MKRCPACTRTYTDESQKFCLDDGSTLVEETASSFDPQATLTMQGGLPTTPPTNPYGSGAGQGFSGSGAGQSAYGSGSGQGSYGSGSGQSQQPGSWSPTPQSYTTAPGSAPKRSMLPWVLGGAAVVIVGVIGLIVVLAIALSGSSNSNSNNSNSNSDSTSNSGKSNSNTSGPANVVIRSSDGSVQVSVPPAWKSTTKLNDNAKLQVSDPANEMYLIVLTDSKSKYTDMDLDKHSSATLDTLSKAMTYSNKVGPTRITIDGNTAVQYELRGEIKNIKVVYIHTTVETSLHYQQIVAWTLESKYSEQVDKLKNVINSFKEN